MARVAVVGASGLIGGALVRALVARGDEVLAVSRSGGLAIPGARDLRWDPADGDPPAEVVAGDAVVNLAGAPIGGGRWTAERKRLLRESRVDTTARLAAAIAAGGGTTALVNGSAVGYYGARNDDRPVTERDPAGDDFLGRTCQAWEEATAAAERAGARVVRVRTGLVLAAEGGILPRLRTLSRLLIGGPVGGGEQWLPWIALEDIVGVYLRAIDDTGLSGPLNGAAPNPVTQREFMRVLGGVLGRPAVVPTPAVAVRLALGEMSTLVLDGQRAVPAVLTAADFPFARPALEGALRAILNDEAH